MFNRLARRALPYLIVCASLAIAQESSIVDTNTPTDTATPSDATRPSDTATPGVPQDSAEPMIHLSEPAEACAVAPLPAVEDPAALAFENGTASTGAIDTGGLSPAMARSLQRFQAMVTRVGGTFELKSAYRPPAYQAHLQAVWFNWMDLRNNKQPGCQLLRAEVQDEFARHHLIETQKPVTSSDHTRGLAFDAVVILPKVARLKRRRVSLDRLALMAGIKRPDIVRDPVHFKLWSSHLGRRG